MGSPNSDSELIVKTDENALLDTGRRWDVHVGDIKREVVDGAVYEEYLGDIKKEVVPNGPVVETYTQNHFTTVDGKRSQEYAQQKKVVKGLFDETIGSHKVTITGGLNETVTGGDGVVRRPWHRPPRCGALRGNHLHLVRLHGAVRA
jgi:hypothetical protein